MSTWSRVAVAFVFFGVTASALLVWLVVLLPSRRARIAAGGAFARWVAPPLMRIFGHRLEVVGRERIEESRPAVFLINHSSSIDTFASMAMWPRLGVCVGKREVIYIPFFGVAYILSGQLRIDRSDRASAVAALRGLVEPVRRFGLSPWIAPEGTRSRDGALGAFKKGFVHVALATGLPCVPVVFHNTRALWPTPGFRIRPGTVQVEVLEPIPTDDWSKDTIDQHVAEVRAVFESALARGPAGPP